MCDSSKTTLDFVTSISGSGFRQVEETLDDGYVRLHISEAERRQARHDIRCVEDVVVELLRNSRDAGATKIFIATNRTEDCRNITIIDDGCGIPESMHERVFEPRITSKLETMVMDKWGVHGRGMALYSVRENVALAKIACSDKTKGCAILISCDCSVLQERSDQSTWPQIERANDDSWKVTKGTRNILRHAVEFACEHPGLNLYLGSPTEILATITSMSRYAMEQTGCLIAEDIESLLVWQRPGMAADANELAKLALSVGLSVSERTAHRILSDEISATDSIMQIVSATGEFVRQSVPDIYRNRKGLKIHPNDLVDFRREITAVFDALAEKYFFYAKTEPKIRITRDAISVRFEIEKDD